MCSDCVCSLADPFEGLIFVKRMSSGWKIQLRGSEFIGYSESFHYSGFIIIIINTILFILIVLEKLLLLVTMERSSKRQRNVLMNIRCEVDKEEEKE